LYPPNQWDQRTSGPLRVQGRALAFPSLLMQHDTIFALASGSIRAAVSVMRLSGMGSGDMVAALCGGALPQPRRASLRRLRSGDGVTLDHALVLWLPEPGSYTGEDSAELHLHGGRAVTEAVAAALVSLGARP